MRCLFKEGDKTPNPNPLTMCPHSSADECPLPTAPLSCRCGPLLHRHVGWASPSPLSLLSPSHCSRLPTALACPYPPSFPLLLPSLIPLPSHCSCLPSSPFLPTALAFPHPPSFPLLSPALIPLPSHCSRLPSSPFLPAPLACPHPRSFPRSSSCRQPERRSCGLPYAARGPRGRVQARGAGDRGGGGGEEEEEGGGGRVPRLPARRVLARRQVPLLP